MITGSVVRWASASAGIIFIWEGLRLSPDWLLDLTEWGRLGAGIATALVTSSSSAVFNSPLDLPGLGLLDIAPCYTPHHHQHTHTHTHTHIYAQTPHTNLPPCLFSWERESKKQDRGALHRFAAIVCQSFCVCVCVCVFFVCLCACVWERERERGRERALASSD